MANRFLHSPNDSSARPSRIIPRALLAPTHGHPPRLLFDRRYAFASGTTIPNYDVSPDGQRFVMVKDDSGSGRLNVVLNWGEELKRLVPTK